MRAAVQSDGVQTWVNSPDGMCIGRFGRMVVDVHHDIDGQRAGLHCLDCRRRTRDLDADWRFFVDAMLQHHKVVVPERHKPGVNAPFLLRED